VAVVRGQATACAAAGLLHSRARTRTIMLYCNACAAAMLAGGMYVGRAVFAPGNLLCVSGVLAQHAGIRHGVLTLRRSCGLAALCAHLLPGGRLSFNACWTALLGGLDGGRRWCGALAKHFFRTRMAATPRSRAVWRRWFAATFWDGLRLSCSARRPADPRWLLLRSYAVRLQTLRWLCCLFRCCSVCGHFEPLA